MLSQTGRGLVTGPSEEVMPGQAEGGGVGGDSVVDGGVEELVVDGGVEELGVMKSGTGGGGTGEAGIGEMGAGTGTVGGRQAQIGTVGAELQRAGEAGREKAGNEETGLLVTGIVRFVNVRVKLEVVLDMESIYAGMRVCTGQPF